MVQRVAILTAGGYAPCLSAAVGMLIERYDRADPGIEIIGYRHGYQGLLSGDHVVVDAEARRRAAVLQRFGGSPLGNSRVKLTNDDDCRERGLIGDDETALEVAAARLGADGVDVLHTIGGDDTSTAAADLAAYLEQQGVALTVVGLPKTIDNDIVPVRQSLGALTAAEEAARFARNVLAEHGASSRMLIVHEVMGRASGWLTASAARCYLAWHAEQEWVPSVGLTREGWGIHAVYVPEMPLDIEAEGARLRTVMDEVGCVNIFLAEGAGANEIVAELEAAGEEVQRDPFGHVKIDTINPGKHLAKAFAGRIGAEKKMVQKSGYFSRSAPAHEADLRLIDEMVRVAVDSALAGRSGLVGHDEERDDELRAIELDRVAGHKPFDATVPWFTELLDSIGQPH